MTTTIRGRGDRCWWLCWRRLSLRLISIVGIFNLLTVLLYSSSGTIGESHTLEQPFVNRFVKPSLLSSSSSSTTRTCLSGKKSSYPVPGWKRNILDWLGRPSSNKTIGDVGSLPIPPNTPGAFLHVGKTGGSTLTTALRYGCHSWVPKPCNLAQFNTISESYISPLTTYYHIPDFELLAPPDGDVKLDGGGGGDDHPIQYKFFVWTLRDPYARTLSAFTWLHPKNAKVYLKRKVYIRRKKNGKIFFNCFPTLQDFADALGTDKGNDSTHAGVFNANDDKITTVADLPILDENKKIMNISCNLLAKAALQNKIYVLDHLYFDFKLLHQWVSSGRKSMAEYETQFSSEITPNEKKEMDDTTINSTTNDYSTAGRQSADGHDVASSFSLPSVSTGDDDTALVTYLAIRQEFMWQDWKSANTWLGQLPEAVHLYKNMSKRMQTSGVTLEKKQSPVTKDIDNIGQRNLCQALLQEYRAYFDILCQSANLSPRDKRKSWDIAISYCPVVEKYIDCC